MKRIVFIAVAAISCAFFAGRQAGYVIAEQSMTSGCKSACLAEASTGKVIYESNAEERLPIASVCKVMTLTLCFDAVESGKLKPDELITVSENAAGMGGSQVFLQSGLQYPVSELIKSIIVCSANDSCVALAEAISGSEEAFVADMNARAEALGCANTLFANCTGLPKATQYSCAKDVAVMFGELIKNPRYFSYSKIWLEDFKHPDDRITSMTNTNKLIKKYALCDGGKTGFTNDAGFCLAATAERDNMRLVSVVLGGSTSDARFDGTVNLFNYGFANFKNKIVLDSNVNLNDKLCVNGGKKPYVSIRPQRNGYVFCAADSQPDITFNIVTQKVCAPVCKGDPVGEIEVYSDGVLCDRVTLVCAEDVPKANFYDNWVKIADNWCM